MPSTIFRERATRSHQIEEVTIDLISTCQSLNLTVFTSHMDTNPAKMYFLPNLPLMPGFLFLHTPNIPPPLHMYIEVPSNGVNMGADFEHMLTTLSDRIFAVLTDTCLVIDLTPRHRLLLQLWWQHSYIRRPHKYSLHTPPIRCMVTTHKIGQKTHTPRIEPRNGIIHKWSEYCWVGMGLRPASGFGFSNAEKDEAYEKQLELLMNGNKSPRSA